MEIKKPSREKPEAAIEKLKEIYSRKVPKEIAAMLTGETEDIIKECESLIADIDEIGLWSRINQCDGVTEVFVGHRLVNCYVEEGCEDIEFKEPFQHTNLTAFNCDFGWDNISDQYEPIGTVSVIPNEIETTQAHTLHPSMLLVRLKHGASYWVKNDDFFGLIKGVA